MRVNNDDARIDVRVDGEMGDAIVLLAGFPLTREIWDSQAEALAEKFCVIRPDLRGIGTSKVSEGPYLMETLAGDIAATLDALGVERAAIAGHSLGGYVAIAFARMYSERLTRLALVCSRIDADSPEMMATRREIAQRAESAKSIEPVVDFFVPRMLSQQRYDQDTALRERVSAIARSVDYRGAAAMLRGMALRDPGTDIAPDLEFPVLVVAGGDDRLLSLEVARETAAAFPNARLVEIEESGHLPMLEAPAALEAALEDWMRASG